MTFLGNTLVTLLALSNAYNLKSNKFKCVLVGGDDSLLCYEGDMLRDRNKYIQGMFNLISKFE